MPYNPTAAPNPEPRVFKNIVRCAFNRLISLGTAVAEGVMRELPEGEDAGAPYWDLRYIALDSRLDTGGDYTVRSGAKLFTKDGKIQDNRQRPFQVSQAFAGLALQVFPGDPTGAFDVWCAAHGHEAIGANEAYDESQIIGNIFMVQKPASDKSNPKDPARFAAPLPITVLGPEYQFTGEVQIIPTQQGTGGSNEAGQQAPSTASFVDILQTEAAMAAVLAAISGQSVDALDDALIAAGITHTYQINGEAVLGAAIGGSLVGALEAAGKITNANGVVVLVEAGVNGASASESVPESQAVEPPATPAA